MQTNNVATDKSRIVAYVQPQIKEKLERLAEVRLRSLSNLIESVLVDEIAKAEASGELESQDTQKKQQSDRA